MNWKKVTGMFTILTITSVAIYDVVAISNGGTEASISHLMILWAYKFPLFPFCVGVVCGHLFWRMKATKETTLTIDSEYKNEHK